MCGIAGFLSDNCFNPEDARVLVRRMADRLAHRGPDSSGEWIDGEAGVAIAHRRLSIIDLTSTGHQPMPSPSGRYILTFNGEIYNHQSLREKLHAGGNSLAFRGSSDTETLCVAFDCWGLERTLKFAAGMFALAVWDRKERVLSIARDRIGEKPLYYGVQGDTFLFASELKSVRTHPAFLSRIDEEAMPLYLRHGYVPSPWSIWAGIKKLLPGSILKIRSDFRRHVPEPAFYWTLGEAIQAGREDPIDGPDEDVVNEFDSLLRQTVASQMEADVPLGAFLSGGIDSSTIVALMQAQSQRAVKTFTIGFTEAKYNEAKHAAAVAQHLGTDHTELYVSPQEALSVIPQLPTIYDEPFGDSSAIPTFLVSQLASQHVTVALSGDGGDELLGGYGRYNLKRAEAIWRFGRRFRHGRKCSLLESAQLKIAGAFDSWGNSLAKCLDKRIAIPALRPRIEMILALSECKNIDEVYLATISQWYDLPLQKHIGEAAAGPPYVYALDSSLEHALDRIMATDTLSYLPEDILVKVDRAAMAQSLETRVPLLDHRVVEFCWRLPRHMKVRDGRGKWLLREVLDRYVPSSIVDRPKMGFGIPVAEWLRGPLRDWAENLLSESNLGKEGILDPYPIRKRWTDHLKGRRSWADSLWLVLMFLAWLDNIEQTDRFESSN